MASRYYTDQTLKNLFGRSGNACAFPGCDKKELQSADGGMGESFICHIEALEEKGPRYRQDMTDDMRNDYQNLIVLCLKHHDIIDKDTQTYTVERLHAMKREHEIRVTELILQKRPTMLADLILKLSEYSLDKQDSVSNSLNPFKPEGKIKYNNLQRNSFYVDEYKVYHAMLNNVYSMLDEDGGLKKEKILRRILDTYINVKMKYVKNLSDPMAEIRQNADTIFEEVFSILEKDLGSLNLQVEDIEAPLKIVLVDAFLRCKILEEPK